jgi:hypothetical protein
MQFIDILNQTNATYLINSKSEFRTEFGASSGFGGDGEAGATNDLQKAKEIVKNQGGYILIRDKNDLNELVDLD